MKIPAVPPLPAARGPELLHRVRGGRAPHPALRGQQHLRRPDPDLPLLRREVQALLLDCAPTRGSI